MSESQINEAIPAQAAPSRKRPGLAVWLAVAALGVAGWQFYTTQQQLDSMRQELARRLAEGSGAGKEQRAIAEQAMLVARATDGKLALVEARVNEAAGQYATLNGMYQELTKNRTDWLLSEIEHTLAIASQQLQLAGNVSAAVSALEMVDARLAKFDRPQLIGVKKAVATDLEKLKALPYLDTVGLTVKIDRLMLSVDSLPLVVDSHRLGGAQPGKPAQPAADAPWWERLSAEISGSLGELIHIRRMDKPEALLLSPEQAFFLRENLKMRLLDARLALMQRDGKTYAADIAAARSYVQRYFDRDAAASSQWLATLGELEGAPLDISLPDMSASLKAVRDAQGNSGE
ncbi:uroporphyrinogen-III C-methyltransferase [Chromobacterium vaccinii]|uniref:uroporphyrinogen-III C-methyltransferase n=1 Tax=Chromobacterium vaccinii TaxID=1108595 RepID=UPI000E1732FD|nr:uroporphyrinogen-III C-methyltransferase [Chromobacterium vaccinii]SUX29439.1 Putative uroporphyrinogen-III C-methyltransferase [Chromobacterium vaccinii]